MAWKLLVDFDKRYKQYKKENNKYITFAKYLQILNYTDADIQRFLFSIRKYNKNKKKKYCLNS